jgi:Zn-dependent protease with chaperone function
MSSQRPVVREARLGPQSKRGTPTVSHSHTMGEGSLRVRTATLAVLEPVYALGTNLVAGGLLVIGGFVPVLGRWMNDRVTNWSDAVRVLGGVPPEPEPGNPDTDLGPVLARSDAAPLFEEIESLARRAGIRPPGQVRLSYLPCCGVVAWGSRRRRRTRALLIGLPLIHVLNRGELRAVLAHELAHLAYGDPTSAERSGRFVGSLGRALDDPSRCGFGPLRLWATCCHRMGERLLAPVALAREDRADRFAAVTAGGQHTASALVKVALVQSLFREVLDRYDPNREDTQWPSLYSFFRAFWDRLPPETITAMRHTLLAEHARPDATHPPLIERLSRVQAYEILSPSDHTPADAVIGDLEAMEQLLHNRLFDSVPGETPTLFHRAGS